MAMQGSITALEHLHRRLFKARATTDSLFEIIREDALYERPIPERHRILFYIGHLEAFDWNLFREHLFRLDSFLPAFDRLFAFGIDPVDGGLPSDRAEDWPSVPEVRRYVQILRGAIDDGLVAGKFPGLANAQDTSAETLLHVAIEHRLMHAETLAYMVHQLPYSKKLPQSQSPSETAPIVNDLLEIPAGRATLGLSRGASAPFGWDNEFESSIVTVPRFKISKFMISNAEFLRFVEDGGYQNSKYWSPEDWRWKQLSAVRHPVFWKQEGSTWSYRGMFEELPFRSNWPVYVSHAESSAYARWANGCLPTEAQWHRAAYGTPEGTERAYPWGSSSPTPELGNLDFERWDPESVDRNPANKSAWGVVGQLGNGWEWTATPFAPFPGFEPAAYYPGYSANFFDGQHYVIKGGSARTASCLLRRSFRNWFQPHYQYVYTGFRCVTD